MFDEPVNTSQSNRVVSGTTPVYYWVDRDGELRLTDKSAIKIGCEVKAVYQNIDAVPQDIVDQIISHNKMADNIKGVVQLTYYKDAYKYKITDKIKTGKSSSIAQRTMSSEVGNKNANTSILFGATKLKNATFATIKLYDGGKRFVEQILKAPTYGTYHYDYGSWPDPYVSNPPLQRLVGEKLQKGHFANELIEVISGTFGAYTPGIYQNSGGWYNDSRYHTTHVGRGTYEEVIANVFENHFDVVLSEGGNNTYNKQLGYENLNSLKIGVKVGDNLACVLSSGNTSEKQGNIECAQTMPPDAKFAAIGGVPGVYDVHGELYSNGGAYIGAIQQLSGDVILHVEFSGSNNEYSNFTDIFTDFNISDTENFCVSRTRGNISNNESILIPKGSNPTIEIILIPKKWKYFVWVLGAYGTHPNKVAKWNAHDFFGTAPANYGVGAGVCGVGGETCEAMGGMGIFGVFGGSGGMSYSKYSNVSTPSGRVFGPVGFDASVEDMIFTGLTFNAKARKDSLGNLPYQGNQWSVFPSMAEQWSHGYSAWACPRYTGQLVAIIRMLYNNGAQDYRYVYSKTASTDEPVLKAYANALVPFGNVAYSGTCQWYIGNGGGFAIGAVYNNAGSSNTGDPGTAASGYITEDNFAGFMETMHDGWYLLPRGGTLGGWIGAIEAYRRVPIVESVIDPYYQALYAKIARERYVPGVTYVIPYPTLTGPVYGHL